MLFADHLVVVRGGGDLATGAIARLHRAGFPVVVLELDPPLTVRRTVAVSTAVTDGTVRVEDLFAQRVASPEEAVDIAMKGTIAVVVSPRLPQFREPPAIVVDARLAKRNIDTTAHQASLVIGLGPGFAAGEDCHAVVETMRGHRLGRVIWQGSATPNTGVPGRIGGEDAKRVLRSAHEGIVKWRVAIGDAVTAGQPLGTVGAHDVHAEIGGVVRGLIAERFPATVGLKIGDLDPRADAAACWAISDKSLSVGGGVLEAVLMHLNR